MTRKNLQNARKAAGLTQQAMADKLSISLRHYQRIECGTSHGTYEMWDKLEDIFSIHQRKLRETQATYRGQATNQSTHQKDLPSRQG